MEKKRILVVEDEIIIGMEIADRLKSMGYEVIRIVANGEMAIKTSLSEKPDLILMDIMIQGSMDGIDTANQILLHIDVPIIYLTANADESTLERAKISDAFGYLIKPFEEKELNTSIEMALYKHQMEAKLRESEERFKSLVENSSIGIFRLSKEGRILHGNPTFMKLLGYSQLNQIVGKMMDDFLFREDENFKGIYQLIDKNESVERKKLKIINSQNNELYISLSGNFVKWEDEVLYFDGTIEDITKEIKYQKELIKAKEKAEESDRLKTEFLAGMSHEIRTPINTIMNYLSLLNDELNSASDSVYKDIFEAIQVGSLRLTRTIDSILNMAQFQSGTFDIFKVKLDLIDEVLSNLYQEFKFTAKQRGLELKFKNEAESAVLLADKYSLSQLFVNLIDNALKYTRQGFVELHVYNNHEGFLSVDVSDSGIGISEDFIPTLFKPFTQEEQGYTRKFDGNGLGLALVKRYCELNEAVIKVKSVKGEGTCFTVTFTNANRKDIYSNKQFLKETGSGS